VKYKSPLVKGLLSVKQGDVLLSHPVSRAVPSVLEGLTSVFGMGTGVTPPLWSPSFHMIDQALTLMNALSQLNSGTNGKRTP
jgi:hypothetical protein